MKTIQFKTNINCATCVSKVQTTLDANQSINTWKVETEIPTRLLTIESDDLDEENLIHSLKKLGFTAEKI